MGFALVAHTVAAPGTNGGTTSAIDTTGASLLVVAVSAFGGTPTTVSDSKGNTWTALTEQAASSDHARLFYAVNPTVGSGHTFTFSQSSTFPAILAAAFSGADTSSPFDSQVGAAATSPGTISPSADNELLITSQTDASTGTRTIGSGFTKTDSVAFSSGANLGGALAYLIQTTKGDVVPTWSVGVASVAACFKAAAGGGATVHPWWTCMLPGGGGA